MRDFLTYWRFSILKKEPSTAATTHKTIGSAHENSIAKDQVTMASREAPT